MSEEQAAQSRRSVRQRTQLGAGSPFEIADAEHGVEVRIVRGSPTADEIAAVTAVLSTALAEEAAACDGVDAHRRTAWQRSQRAIRRPLER